jgi:uncharacterized RDD family membrane protein YckC
MVTDLQKAGLWKRISAGLFDLIMVVMVAVGMAALLSWVLNVDTYSQTYSDAYSRYQTQYGVQFDITQEAFEALSPQEREAYDAAYEAFVSDEEVLYNYNMIVNLALLIGTFSILIAVVLLEFVVPLLLKNGQTLGKKIFGLGVMRQDGVKINGRVLFIRTILGKYTIETMVPMMILMMIYLGTLGLEGTLVILALLIAQVIMLIATQKRLVIHDALASTVVVDLGSQMIFDSPEAKVAYIEKKHAERARRAEY